MDKEWCKENYEKSLTSKVWVCTPYDAGWDESKKNGVDLFSSNELKAIFEEEAALGEVPAWAAEILNRMMIFIPTCGHYAFPLPLTQICEAIGEEKAPEFVCSCYTADSKRKVLMSYYVYCLDAWLKNAPIEIATAELAMRRDDLGKDWPQIAAAIYNALGVPSEHKEILIKRLIHRLRWWIKTLVWFDDKRDRYMLDVYSGDARGDEANWGAYGNPPFGDPYFAERRLPEIRELADQIREKVPDGDRLLDYIESTWLCAPKVFRFLEKLILEIGSMDSDSAPDDKLSILQCEDTYPDFASCQKWYSSFKSSLANWLDGDQQALVELGDINPVKHWLAKVLQFKLELYEVYNNFGNLVGARPSGRCGSKMI